MKCQPLQNRILELRSQKITHYDSVTGEAVYTAPKIEAVGTYRCLLEKKAELTQQALAESVEVVLWITPPPPSEQKKGDSKK